MPEMLRAQGTHSEPDWSLITIGTLAGNGARPAQAEAAAAMQAKPASAVPRHMI